MYYRNFPKGLMSNTKIIIGLVGEISSGKGTVAKYLEEKHGAGTFSFSTIIREVLDTLCLPHSRKNMQKMSTVLRQNFGQDVLGKVIAANVKNDNNKIIAVDGIRRMPDIKYLTELDNFILTKIIAAAKIRYERLIARTENQGDTQKTYEEFLSDHQKEADAHIPEVMEHAVAAINNNGDMNELYQQIDNLLTKKTR